MIVPLGRWVLEEACRQGAHWQTARGGRPLSVAVNVSTRQLDEPGLVEGVAQALRSSGLPAALLTLEVTETTLADASVAEPTLTALQGLGVRIALDDFGTGYSSLNYLHRFPIDIIKIDRSFVRDIVTDVDDAAIVKATIGLAASLGMLTTAEGVETREQLAFLQEHGCRFGQGFLFSPPVEADAFAALLREERVLGAA